MSPDDVAILTQAKEILAQGWIQNKATDHYGRVCAGQAIQNATVALVGKDIQGPAVVHEWQHRVNEVGALLMKAAWERTGRHWMNVPLWNDFPGRTHEEILDTFDHAIKLAERDSRAPVATRAG
jgi:hypothetical protein